MSRNPCPKHFVCLLTLRMREFTAVGIRMNLSKSSSLYTGNIPQHLARVNKILREERRERESADSVPFLEEFQEFRGGGVHFSARQSGPLVLGKPKDLGVKV